MRKLLELDTYFPTGEPTVQVVMSVGRDGRRLFEKNAFDRSAASPALDYIRTVQPEDGCTIILVNAMGAFEAYDDNRNGDSFPNYVVNKGRRASCGHPGCQGPAWVGEDEVLSKHFKSFMKAHFFEHHKNKDPEKAFGNVMQAFWNDRMQRVELLLRLFNAKNKKLADRIKAGEYPAVSMGCRVPYDVCNVCGHHAPTRAEYCVHAREKLRQVMPDGVKVCVHNPRPDFFDISGVWRPADPTGFTMKKVANHALWEGWSAQAGEELDAHDAKVAEAKKFSEIRKRILGRAMATRSSNTIVDKFQPVAKAEALSEGPKSDKAIAAIAEHPLAKAAAALYDCGVLLSASDITRVLYKQSGISPTSRELDVVVAAQPLFDDLVVYDPSLREKFASILDLQGAREKTAGLGNYILSKMSPDGIAAGFHATSPPKTDLFTMTDPMTGHQYQTTRGAAQAAKWEVRKDALLKSLLLSGAYGLGLRASGISGRIGMPLTAVASGLAGYGTYRAGQEFFRPMRNPSYVTDQGVRVPGNTEFVKASAVTEPKIWMKYARDFYERTGDVVDPIDHLTNQIVSGNPNSSLSQFFGASSEARVNALAKCATTADNELDLGTIGQFLVEITMY